VVQLGKMQSPRGLLAPWNVPPVTETSGADGLLLPAEQGHTSEAEVSTA